MSKPLVRKSFWLCTMSNIKDNIYWHAIHKILSFLNRILHEDLGPAPDITLTTLFCSLNTWCTCVEFLQNIIQLHYTVLLYTHKHTHTHTPFVGILVYTCIQLVAFVCFIWMVSLPNYMSLTYICRFAVLKLNECAGSFWHGFMF